MELHTIHDKEFAPYGRVIDCDCSEIIDMAKKIELPKEGSTYLASVEDFENLEVKTQLEKEYFGEIPIQVGYCFGHSTKLNGFEWHKSSEINIAVTDAILFLGNIAEMENDRYNSENAKAFLLKRGDIVEVYATTLHFCPCEVTKDGFGVVVVLPKGTNTNLEHTPKDKKMFKKNKWIIAHEDNDNLLKRGVVPGVYGKNFEVGKDI